MHVSLVDVLVGFTTLAKSGYLLRVPLVVVTMCWAALKAGGCLMMNCWPSHSSMLRCTMRLWQFYRLDRWNGHYCHVQGRCSGIGPLALTQAPCAHITSYMDHYPPSGQRVKSPFQVSAGVSSQPAGRAQAMC